MLGRIDKVTKSAGLIRQHASTIGDASESLRGELSRLLPQDLSALTATTDSRADNATA